MYSLELSKVCRLKRTKAKYGITQIIHSLIATKNLGPNATAASIGAMPSTMGCRI